MFCYFSFGTAEDYRSDYSRFPQTVLGGLVCDQQVPRGLAGWLA